MSKLIIFDTDMDTDCDDAGALAVLHNLETRGEAKILAVVCSAPTQWGAPCIEHINTFFGRPTIPVGELKYVDVERYIDYKNHVELMGEVRLYNKVLGCGFEKTYPSAVSVYRKALSQQDDKSVTICATGLLSVLEMLLKSCPDEHSSMDGMSLVRSKVKKLVTMAEIKYPQGGDESFNWKMDRKAACYVLNNWPTSIAVSSYGRSILAGKNLWEQTAENHPVRQAFLAFFEGKEALRPCWDQIAVLYAVRGASDMFLEEKDLTIRGALNSELFYWQTSSTMGKDLLIRPAISDDSIATVIDELML